MTSESLNLASIKTRKARKTYSPAERAEILMLCQQPDASILEIATLYDIHENTIYKWRHKAKQTEQFAKPIQTQTAFIPIPLNTTTDDKQLLGKVVRIEIPQAHDQQSIVLKWPIESVTELSLFIREFMS